MALWEVGLRFPGSDHQGAKKHKFSLNFHALAAATASMEAARPAEAVAAIGGLAHAGEGGHGECVTVPCTCSMPVSDEGCEHDRACSTVQAALYAFRSSMRRQQPSAATPQLLLGSSGAAAAGCRRVLGSALAVFSFFVSSSNPVQ